MWRVNKYITALAKLRWKLKFVLFVKLFFCFVPMPIGKLEAYHFFAKFVLEAPTGVSNFEIPPSIFQLRIRESITFERLNRFSWFSETFFVFGAKRNRKNVFLFYTPHRKIAWCPVSGLRSPVSGLRSPREISRTARSIFKILFAFDSPWLREVHDGARFLNFLSVLITLSVKYLKNHIFTYFDVVS